MSMATFIKAFKANHSGFRGECNCGREFYNPDDCWDFEDEEIEYLIKDPNATELLDDVRYVEFNNREYVIGCDCWQEKARHFINLISNHDVQIAKYLNGERARKIYEAEQVQIIKILSDDGTQDPEFDDDIPF